MEKEEKEDSTNQTTEELTSEKIEELKLEKKELQKFLHKYQTNFAKRNRRPVQFVQDREPVKKEYLRYKVGYQIKFNTTKVFDVKFWLFLN